MRWTYTFFCDDIFKIYKKGFLKYKELDISGARFSKRRETRSKLKPDKVSD